MATDVALQQAIQALRAGDRVAAHTMLQELTEAQPALLDGWLWLAAASQELSDKRAALERALALGPSDPRVLAGLRALGVDPAVLPPVASPDPARMAASAAPRTPAAPAHPLAAARFVPTDVRARPAISWRLVVLASLLLVAIPLVVLLSS